MIYELLLSNPIPFSCTNCSYGFEINQKSLKDYFHGIKIHCQNCNAQHDLWEVVLKNSKNDFGDLLYALIGASFTAIKITIQKNEFFDLDLTKVDMLLDAKILDISYQSRAIGLHPLEVHGHKPQRDTIPHIIKLYGLPVHDPPKFADVMVVVTWIEKSKKDEVWNNFIRAIELFYAKEYQLSIVPTNAMVEAKMSLIMYKYFQKFASNDRVESFLQAGATYSYQLNILLPMIADFYDLPRVPDYMKANLNKLRNIRNSLAHSGITKTEVDRHKVSELLTSAVFILSYLNIVDEKMMEKIK